MKKYLDFFQHYTETGRDHGYSISAHPSVFQSMASRRETGKTVCLIEDLTSALHKRLAMPLFTQEYKWVTENYQTIRQNAWSNV